MGCLEAEAWEIGVLDEWREVLSLLEQFDIWSQPEEDIDLTIIDYQWTFVELRISWTYQKAFFFALLRMPDDFHGIDRKEIERVTHLANHHIFRGNPISPSFQDRTFPRDGTASGERTRKLMARIRRLRDLHDQLVAGKANSCRQVLSLRKKLFGRNGQSKIPLEDIPQEIGKLEEQVALSSRMEAQQRIIGWKSKMRNDYSAKAAWLNKKFSPLLAVEANQGHTESKAQAGEALREHWASLQNKVSWNSDAEINQCAAEVSALLASALPQDLSGLHSRSVRPTLAVFKKALGAIRGSGGLDGWLRHDLRLFAAVDSIATMIWEAMESWEVSGCTPSIIRHSKVTCVGKDRPVQNGALKAGSFRPITVLSGLWRAWSTAWLQMPALQRWRKDLFPIGISGGSPQCLGAEALAALPDQALHFGGYGVSLDFSHAFDCVNPVLAQEVFSRILPPAFQRWGRLLCAQWQQLHKWFCYGGHFCDQPLTGMVGILQGDPAFPFALLTLLLAGKISVELSLQEEVVFQCIYMDDRLIVTRTAEGALRARQCWNDFAQRLHLLENLEKAQFVAVNGQCTVLGVHFLCWCEHLGACIGCPPVRQWRAFPKHQRRLDKAEGASFKIGLLPVVVRRKVLDSRCFSISRFAYGWINRLPPTKWCQRLDQKVWKSLGEYQYSGPELKQVIVGGHLSISACVIWRATRLLALRDFARA